MYGILFTNPDNSLQSWFLHNCVYEYETFQYNPDNTTYYSFNSTADAITWLNLWYNARVISRKWVPPISSFTAALLPDIVKSVRNNNQNTTDTYIAVC